MSKIIIQEIKAELKKRYPNYTFEMTESQSGLVYTITVFKERKSLDSINVQSTTPITEFWDNVRVWMVGIITRYR